MLWLVWKILDLSLDEYTFDFQTYIYITGVCDIAQNQWSKYRIILLFRVFLYSFWSLLLMWKIEMIYDTYGFRVDNNLNAQQVIDNESIMECTSMKIQLP